MRARSVSAPTLHARRRADSILKSLADEHPLSDLPHVHKETRARAEFQCRHLRSARAEAARRNTSHFTGDDGRARPAALSPRRGVRDRRFDSSARVEAVLRHAEELPSCLRRTRRATARHALAANQVGAYELSVSSSRSGRRTDLVLTFAETRASCCRSTSSDFRLAHCARSAGARAPAGLILFRAMVRGAPRPCTRRWFSGRYASKLGG